MGFRFVAFGDLHMGNTLPFARRAKGLVTDRLEDTCRALAYMRQYALDNGIHHTLSLGDLLDKRLLDGVTMNAAVGELVEYADAGLSLTLIKGNHEAADAAGSAFTLDAFAHLRPEHIHLLDGKGTHLPSHDDGYSFMALSYRPDKLAREELRRIGEKPAKFHRIALLHQNLAGGRVGNWVNEDGITGDDLDGFAFCFAGHYHDHQRIGSAQYLGAPMQHHFADAGKARGFWDITLGTEIEMTMVPIPDLPLFHVVQWDGSTTPEVPEMANAYVELQFKGTAEALKKLTREAQGFVEDWTKAGARLVKLNPSLLPTRKERSAVAALVGKGTRPPWPAAVDGYLDACDTVGLDRARLKALALEALTEAES